MPSVSRMVLATIAVLTASLALTTVAQAAFDFTEFGGSATDTLGAIDTRAGAHPEVATKLAFTTILRDDGLRVPDGQMKDISVDLPPGLVGNPASIPAFCTVAKVFNNGALIGGDCPIESQVGILTPLFADVDPATPVDQLDKAVVNLVEAPAGVLARLAANVNGVVTVIDVKLRADRSYALTADIRNVSQSLPLRGAQLTLWGVPADPAHDATRFDIRQEAFGAASNALPQAFMTAPTSCPRTPLKSTATATSWDMPNVLRTASFDRDFDGFPLVTQDCASTGFDPAATVIPTDARADAPTGLNVDLDSPQNIVAPNGVATAHLKDVSVTLPEGLSINPGSAAGLEACTDAQLGLGNDDPVTCPAAAKIGTATAKTPVLTEDVTGDVFIRTQASDDPESGAMFRLALVLRSEERGLLVKLPGSVRVNAATGQITTSFDNNPQLPVEHIALNLKDGPRAPLATPASCGDKAVRTDLASWAGHAVTRDAAFVVPCTAGLGGFNPAMSSGTASPVGGAFSPFALSVTKPDGDAVLNGLRMTLPKGLLAQLKGNLGAQVGTVKAFAGPGSNPFMLPGQVYLEGAYGDAPFSLRVVVPAKAGPFDLGEVVVRQKIFVDPITAQVTVVSDPVPTIVKGVPVRLQRLDVNVDKPGFVINPTSCAAKSIDATLSAVGGQTATVTNRFQVGGCPSLELKPSLALSLSGKGQTTDGKHPAVTANLTQPAGQANLKKVRVALPLSLALDPDNVNGLCEFADGSKATPTCPKASIVGIATAVTPILDEPLSGPVYFVKNIRKDPKSGREIRTLPKLVIPLTGQNGLKLTLTGTSNVEDDQLVTTFDNIPDAPVSSFKLNINGGKGGILTVSDADICKSTQIAEQQVDGQNNKSADADVFIQTPSCALKVVSKKVAAKSVTLKVSGLGAGKVTVTGKGIKKTTKTITKSTVATITAKRTKGKPGKVTVSFDPAGPAKARKTIK